MTGEQTVTVTVSPSDASLYTTQSLGFTASVTGTANRGVTWTVVQGPSGGSVTADGLYTAPSGTGVFQVTAASQFAPSVIGTATVTVSDSAGRRHPDDDRQPDRRRGAARGLLRRGE